MRTSAILLRRLFTAAIIWLLGLLLFALPTHAEDYDTVLGQLTRLQALADNYLTEGHEGDAIILTLAYTRTGDYNSATWQLTAGARDPEFENYVAANDGELAALQTVTTITLPSGENIDFGHLLASMNLVYKGIPITGSWGGDCMQLAQVYSGQAADAAGYVSLMQQTFGIDDDGTASKFGDQDLRADLDSVNVGSQLSKDAVIADLLRSYYESLTDYDRAYKFIALSFGTVDTSSANFVDAVYNSLISDTGMQLLLYMNGMWTTEGGWQLKAETEPALRGACTVFANYLSGTVNNERVKSDQTTLMHTSAAQALSDALVALGDSEAAAAALESGSEVVSTATDTAGSRVDSVLNDATATLRDGFDAQIFEVVLMTIGSAALLGMLLCIVMMLRSSKKPKHRRH